MMRLSALDRDAWWIAFSAFFADLGYQAVIAGLPLFLVLTLKAPEWVFGLTTALSYGGGSLIGYLGGRLGDRTGHKRVAVLGNSLIPLLSFTAVASSAGAAVALFTTGWWARNFRTAPRRAMLTQVVTRAQESRPFGLLHALEVGGGMLSALAAFALVRFQVPFRIIFLLTLLPLGLSTVCLLLVRNRPGPGDAESADTEPEEPEAEEPGDEGQAASAAGPRLYWGIIIATALYGFSSYSIGFPILTVAQGTHQESSGILAYAIFLGVSALTGLVVGSRERAGVNFLALLGYFVAGLGSVGLALAYRFQAGEGGFYATVAVLGLALGVIETLEPTLISRLTPASRRGRGLGALTGSRSLGLFIGNLSMGILYQFDPLYSYSYAAAVAGAATTVLLVANRAKRKS